MASVNVKDVFYSVPVAAKHRINTISFDISQFHIYLTKIDIS